MELVALNGCGQTVSNSLGEIIEATSDEGAAASANLAHQSGSSTPTNVESKLRENDNNDDRCLEVVLELGSLVGVVELEVVGCKQQEPHKCIDNHFHPRY